MILALEHLEPRLLLDGATLIAEFASEGALVSLYDVGDGGLTADAVQVSFGSGGAVSSIKVAAGQPTEGLGIVVSGASSVGSVSAEGSLAFIASSAPVKSMSLKGGLAGHNLNGEELGGIAFAEDIDGDGVTDDLTAVYCAGAVGSITLNGDLNGDVCVGAGSGIALTRMTVKGGNVAGDIWLAGAAGRIQLVGDGQSDPAVGPEVCITVAGGGSDGFALQALTVSGDFAGSLVTSGGVQKFSIKGGDLSGALNVDGDLGCLDLRSSGGEGGDILAGALVAVNGALQKLNVAGSILGGEQPENLAQLIAPFIGDVKVRERVENCRILSGIKLGSDWATGGVGEAADTFLQGIINKVSIGGDVEDSLICAGFLPDGGEFDFDWLGDAGSFIDGSRIGSISIGGDLSWDSGGGLPCGIGADSIGSIKLSDFLDYLLVFLGDIL